MVTSDLLSFEIIVNVSIVADELGVRLDKA